MTLGGSIIVYVALSWDAYEMRRNLNDGYATITIIKFIMQ